MGKSSKIFVDGLDLSQRNVTKYILYTDLTTKGQKISNENDLLFTYLPKNERNNCLIGQNIFVSFLEEVRTRQFWF